MCCMNLHEYTCVLYGVRVAKGTNLMRSLGDVGAVVTNMVMGVAGSGGAAGPSASSHGGPASAAAGVSSPSLTRQDSTTASPQASAAAGAAAAGAGSGGSGSSEKQDTLIMDTKLKIIEILQVILKFICLLFTIDMHRIRTRVYCAFSFPVSCVHVYIYCTICCAYACVYCTRACSS